MIKGIIFDFDGLIFDTETKEYQVLQEIFAKYNCELPISLWQKGIGTHSDFSPFKYLEEKTGEKLNHDKLNKLYNIKFNEKLTNNMKARPGVEDYLRTAESLQLKIGLASSSDYNWVSRYLKALNLLGYFQCLKTADDVEHVKPDPALYIKAAKCLGLRAEECLVFEDSANGALAAKRAGMKCVAVPNEVTKQMEFGDIEYKINSMADIELEKIIEIVSK